MCRKAKCAYLRDGYCILHKADCSRALMRDRTGCRCRVRWRLCGFCVRLARSGRYTHEGPDPGGPEVTGTCAGTKYCC